MININTVYKTRFQCGRGFINERKFILSEYSRSFAFIGEDIGGARATLLRSTGKIKQQKLIFLSHLPVTTIAVL
jgi:hypothetical protein